MRNLYIILILLSGTVITNAQQFNWVKTTGGTNTEYSSYVFRDSAGNIYTVGTFTDTVDFDPGPGVYNLFGTGYNNNIFVQKLDADGNFIWAREWNSPDSTIWTNYFYLLLYGAAMDKYGNIILTGGFDSTVDFDPGAGQLLFSSNIESRDVFVLKLDSAGQLQWARQIGGDHFDVSKDVEVDTLGNVNILGHYNNYPSVAVIDLDPGPGVDSYTTQGAGGFVVKLDPFGNYVWGRHFQGQSNLTNILWPTMALDANRNIYIIGDYSGPVDFDPGSGTYILTTTAYATHIFIAKLDSAGSFQWAKKLNNTAADIHTNSIVADLNNDIYVTGYYYYDSVDVDPGIDEHWVHWKNNRDFFIEKLTPDGDFIWVADFPGMGYDDMVKATIDRYNNVICTGIFSDTMDFNPDAGETYKLVGTGGPGSHWVNGFILKLTPGGKMIWARSAAGTEVDTWGNNSGGIMRAVALDPDDNIYVTGDYYGKVDFDINAPQWLVSANGWLSVNPATSDAFLMKLSQSCLDVNRCNENGQGNTCYSTYPYKSANTSACMLNNNNCSDAPDAWGFCRYNAGSWVAWNLNKDMGFTDTSSTTPYFFTNDSVNNIPVPGNLGAPVNWQPILSVAPFNYLCDTIPAIGAIAWWGDHTGDGSGIGSGGHVAYVHCLVDDTVTLTEFNFGPLCYYDVREIDNGTAYGPGNYKPDLYIHIEAGPNTVITQSVNSGIDVFPNPGTGHFRVRLDKGLSKSGQITVYDILGRFIDRKKVNGEQFYSFDLSGHANGSYILHYVSQEKNLTRKIEILK